MAAGGGGSLLGGAGGVRCRGGELGAEVLQGHHILGKITRRNSGTCGYIWAISEAMEEEDSMDGVEEGRARNPLAFLGLQRLVASSFQPLVL